VFKLQQQACVVCKKARPKDDKEAEGWLYLLGAIPLGSMTCSTACLEAANQRIKTTGRCDDK
jgi:predicted nucleic acid-binding Zn ribbon protein